ARTSNIMSEARATRVIQILLDEIGSQFEVNAKIFDREAINREYQGKPFGVFRLRIFFVHGTSKETVWK
ncbi:unnamed protein product, partial [Prorocentrum cordatum]